MAFRVQSLGQSAPSRTGPWTRRRTGAFEPGAAMAAVKYMTPFDVGADRGGQVESAPVEPFGVAGVDPDDGHLAAPSLGCTFTVPLWYHISQKGEFMAAYTSQVAPHAGLNPVTETAPAASGNTAPCGAGLGLLIRTTSGPNTVTITVPGGDHLRRARHRQRHPRVRQPLRRRRQQLGRRDPPGRRDVRRPRHRPGDVRRVGHADQRPVLGHLHQRLRKGRRPWQRRRLGADHLPGAPAAIAEVRRLSLQQHYAAGWRLLADDEIPPAAAGPRTGTDDQGPGRQGRQGRQR